MSRRRANSDEQDALELFLDAMSNMFGGVVFIAVAVVVLLQFTVAATPDDPPVKPDAPPTTPEALQSEIHDLTTILRTQANNAQDTASQQYLELQASKHLAQAQLDTLRREIVQREAELKDAEANTQALNQKRDQQRKALDAAKQALEQVSSQPPERLRVPHFRPSDKQEVPLMLSADRLVSVYKIGPTGPTAQPNSAAFTLDRAAQTIKPTPGRGMLLMPDTARAQLAQTLVGLDPNQHFIAMAVWPDSFDSATAARDVLIDLGFEYGLHFIPANAGIPFNATSGVQ